MAKHELLAAKPKPTKPRAEIRAAPSFYEVTHPVGSAERFLDQAAKEALAAAAAGGVITPRQAAIGAVRAIAKEAGRKYPDRLLEEAVRLPKEELLKRAARAEAFQKAMDVQNKVAAAAAAIDSPVGRMATTLAAADAAEAVQPVAVKSVRQASKGGDAGSETAVSETPVSEAPQNTGGPRIVINPTTFRNSKDALCVAFNEGFRLWMEATGFEPQSEPTEEQRKFFSDTAYADDELQLRRTILARIATFDTSVKDPTDDQLAETASFLNAVLESDWCRNEWERNSVAKLAKAVEASVGAEPVEPRPEPIEPREPEPLQAKADLGGGNTDDEKKEGGEPPPAVPETITDPTEPQEPQDTAEPGNPGQPEEPQEPAEPGNPGQPEEPTPQNAQGVAQEPAGAQGAAQPDNGAAQPAPGQEPKQEPSKLIGLQSGVWTGGEEGKGRQLTAREAEWMKQRIDSGASVSGSQLAMFGLSRNEKGQLFNANGELHTGFDTTETVRANPDAGLDKRDERRRVPGSRKRA